MDTAGWVAIAVAALTGGLARDLFAWLRSAFKKADRRSELERAWDSRDAEARKRRQVEEHASLLTRMLIAAPCVDQSTIPPFPQYTKKE